jgi:hypothetical protein
LGMVGWSRWRPLRRVGTPEFTPHGTRVKVRVWTKGGPPGGRDWQGYFTSKASQTRIDAFFDVRPVGNRYPITGSCGEDDLDKYIETLDAAIEHANTKFQADVLPNLVAQEAQARHEKDAAKKRQASLNKKAKKLARPE